MNKLRNFLLLGSLAISAGLPIYADDNLTQFLEEAKKNLAGFRDSALADRIKFRDEAMKQLQDWASAPWEPKPIEPPIVLPDTPPVPPVIIPWNEIPTPPVTEPVNDEPIVIAEPTPLPPSPKPIIPPAPPIATPTLFTFSSYGTRYAVDAPSAIKTPSLPSFSQDPFDALNTFIQNIPTDALDRLSSSMQREAQNHNLSDWAFYKLIDHFVEAFVTDNKNKQCAIKGLLLTIAGYDIKFAGSCDNGRIYVLTGCNSILIDKNYYILDNVKRYYPFEATPERIDISSAQLEGTSLLSVQPTGKESFDFEPAAPHEIKICLHEPHCRENKCASPVLNISLIGNKNRIEYYGEFPESMEPDNEYSQWNIYAQTEVSSEMKKQLYPKLKESIKGMTAADAANVLMKFVEAFDYEYDDTIWGRDRAFFPEETLHYPYRDCEDGAILFSRLVRDLLSMPVALVYYPGHLAAAVAFDSSVEGAYIGYNGKKYTICDPTIYYANVGVQMTPPLVDPSKAILIPVR